MARYEAGETLASIARTYDCSPPAISYVVSRSRARHPGTEAPPKAPSATEAQLIKAPSGEPATIGNANSTAPSAPSTNGAPPANGQPSSGAPEPSRGEMRLVQPEANSADPNSRRGEPWPREANGFVRSGAGERNPTQPGPTLPGLPPRAILSPQRAPAPSVPAGPADGDQRRTLHLSLGNAAPGNGGTPSVEPRPAERQNFTSDGRPTQHQPAQHQPAGERFAAPANPGLQHSPAPPDRGRESAREAGFSETRSAAYTGPVQRTDADLVPRRTGNSSYIDKDLRARVDSDIAAFLAAFDAALAEDTQQSRSALREATDRLLRVGARTQIELERLEARMPLPPRDNIGRSEQAWRQR